MSNSYVPKILSVMFLIGAITQTTSAYADIVFGVAGPMTGAYASYGEQFWRGASKAAEDINAAGGVNGEKIRLVRADDACEPKQAVAVAKHLVVQDKVVAVIGHHCSSSTIPASEIYDEAGVLTITPGSTNPTVTERGLTSMFRVCGRDDQQGIVAANYIVDVLKAKKIAVIHDKDTYGQGLADATKAQLRKRGVNEVLYEGLTRGEKDFSSLVTKIRSTQADVVYFGGLHPEAGPLVRQLREQGVNAVFVSGDGIVTDQLVATAGGVEFTRGVLMTFGAEPRELPEAKAVVESFRAKGEEPEGFTLYSYSAVQVLAAGFNGVGSSDSTKVSAWLKSHPIDTVTGRKEFDAKGDLKTLDYVMYEWDAQGKYHQL